MNDKFFIRTIALQLLENIYLQCNHNLTATIDISKIVNKDIDNDKIQKAACYLKEKNYIHYDIAPYQQWTVTITAIGVDWVEECYSVNPTDQIK